MAFLLSVSKQTQVSYNPLQEGETSDRPFLFLKVRERVKERNGTGCPGPVRAAVAERTALPKGKDDGWTEAKPRATVCGYGLTTDWQWAINHSGIYEFWNW
ncbi:LOW QUALITY PROTEIN: hypothetical protein IFM46972_05103 [Aspergillus udagawae]|uniref:Uncharacterized protein n=1 Tax=Aspergillus udagawae TaxID=91492 RepID=A0A8H3NRD8_9EURO|nr:LOW QUALITY PROTEIN: hypothetical protein IFM46972_05103 [Aspergillus udagawae]